MSSPLKSRLTTDMKLAMKARDKQRLGSIRLALAAIKQIEVDERRELSEDDVIAVITKMVKQRRDSIQQYTDAGRNELADIEQSEIDILIDYLPQQLTEAEISALLDQAIADTGASSMKDMGALMGALRPQVQGRADMQQVSQMVRDRLG